MWGIPELSTIGPVDQVVLFALRMFRVSQLSQLGPLPVTGQNPELLSSLQVDLAGRSTKVWL